MDSEPPLPKVQSTAVREPDEAALETVAWQAALGELTGEVVHALNNGLFGVLANLELLVADAEPGSGPTDRLRLVQESARELAETVAALGTLARDDGSGAALDALTRSTVELLRRTGPRRTIVERYPQEPLHVAVDAAAVARRLVVQVLLRSAAAAGPAGALDVEVAAEGGLAVLRASTDGDATAAAEPVLAVAQRLARRAGGSPTAEDASTLRLELPCG